MTEINMQYLKNYRQIKRKTISPHGIWEVSTQHGWMPFEDVQSDIECAYKNMLPLVKFLWYDQPAIIYFRPTESMTYCSLKYQVRRVPSPANEKFEIIHNDLSKTRVVLVGFPANIEKAIAGLEGFISRLRLVKKVSLPAPLEPEQNKEIQQLGLKHGVQVEIDDTSISISGSEARVSDVYGDVSEYLIKIKPDIIYPSTWNPQRSTLTESQIPNINLVSLTSDSPEYRILHAHIQESLLIRPLKIERIQNRNLWEKYFRRRKILLNNKKDVNELQLFYADKKEPAEIYNSENGFDHRLVDKNVKWGIALEFAMDARYCHEKSYKATQFGPRVRQMFVARVLVGESFALPPDGKRSERASCRERV
eukprot:TRINITY_DN9200_c0_g1_i1.p1 TRINITY_DN9200_c0_g1~~TRINITY_DN9200_c0_g1_i1.p1  ORF type:complete len:416 (-),score=65.63 TRINITY_DN9200_c0_g1_i1:11-1105(-)